MLDTFFINFSQIFVWRTVSNQLQRKRVAKTKKISDEGNDINNYNNISENEKENTSDVDAEGYEVKLSLIYVKKLMAEQDKQSELESCNGKPVHKTEI